MRSINVFDVYQGASTMYWQSFKNKISTCLAYGALQFKLKINLIPQYLRDEKSAFCAAFIKGSRIFLTI